MAGEWRSTAKGQKISCLKIFPKAFQSVSRAGKSLKHDFSGNCAIKIACRLPLPPWKTFAYSLVSAFLLCAGLVETSSDQTGVALTDGSAAAGSRVQRVFGYRAEWLVSPRRRSWRTHTVQRTDLCIRSTALPETGRTLMALRKVAKHGERVWNVTFLPLPARR